MRNVLFIVCTFAVLVSVGRAADVEVLVAGLLKEAGAVSYAVDASYGGGLSALYLGYDADGVPVSGAAVRETKTYKKVTTIALVTQKDGQYYISAAEIPNINKLPGQSRNYVETALEDITGKAFRDEAAAKSLVDAVSGATKYYKSVYISYSLMTAKIIEEMKANPAWKRMPLTAE